MKKCVVALLLKILHWIDDCCPTVCWAKLISWFNGNRPMYKIFDLKQECEEDKLCGKCHG